MDISTLGLARNCLPNVPNVIKTTALSIIGCSSNSKHQDTLTEAIVTASRPILQTPASIHKAQLSCNTDWGIGRPWIAKYTISAPPERDTISLSASNKSASSGHGANSTNTDLSLKRALEFGIELLDRRPKDARQPCPIPDTVDVETEWTFHKPGSLPISTVLSYPSRNGHSTTCDIDCDREQEIYNGLMTNVDPSGPTVLHFHGGAFCLMDPSTHRWTTSALAKHSLGRVLSVRYRLSPQNIFPAALLDALQAYLALLAPPPRAFHSPVDSSKIIISGDSSGGCLAASLSLLLITLARHGISILFHGQRVQIPSPPFAGMTLISPWLDITRSLPSTNKNARWDIIAPPPLDAASPPFPPDSIWPTSPPRAETYTTADMVIHPLVSPVAALPHDWTGAPPLFVSCGWEGFADEIEVFARRVYSSSVGSNTNDHKPIVHFEGWQGMPHCFPMVPWNHAGRTTMVRWGTFCSQAANRATISCSTSPSSKNAFVVSATSNLVIAKDYATWTASLSPYKTHTVPLADLGMLSDGSCGYTRKKPLDDETVDTLLEKGRVWRVSLEEEMISKWMEASGDIAVQKNV